MLAQQAVREQRHRLHVAAQPAVVRRGHRGDAALDLVLRRRHERAAHHEHRLPRLLRKCMIALCDATRHLEVYRLVIAGVARDDFLDEACPFGAGERIRDAHGVEAALQALEVLGHPERAPGIDRYDFIDAVAEDEPAVEHRDTRLGGGQEFTVQINDLAHDALPGYELRIGVLTNEGRAPRYALPSCSPTSGRLTTFC